ncbi:MAG: HD domain-containing phosphohydrolase [Burkholderiaceae bacterium]
MTDSPDDTPHFTQAVAELGEKQEVVAAQTIFNTQGVKVLDKGSPINLRLYERLIQHKLASPLEDSLRSASSVGSENIGQAATDIMRDVAFFGRMAPEEKDRKTLINVMESIPLPAAMAFQLTVARDVRPEIYQHLIRTALTAAWLARTPLISRYDMLMAAAGGLLHDIGMLHIDPLLLRPEHVLNREQRRQLYSHPLLSVALLDRHHQYSKEVVRAVGEHHECLDGSGYPRNLGADSISALGKILSLAQVVAAMFAPGRNAPEMRLSVLLRMNMHRYENTMSMQVLGLLKPQLDIMSADIPRMADPMTALRNIDRVLRQWPLDLGDANITATRQEVLGLIARHAGQLRRSLAGVGAVPDQLDQLGPEVFDDTLLTELTLLTREALWQLRTLAQQARRRWQARPDERLPGPLLQWLDEVDTVVGHA